MDDTAESSTDDEAHIFTPKKVLDEVGNPVTGLGGSSNASKKIIKMVDKIAESKFFQAATENRYIKKAMEGKDAVFECIILYFLLLRRVKYRIRFESRGQRFDRHFGVEYSTAS